MGGDTRCNARARKKTEEELEENQKDASVGGMTQQENTEEKLSA